jgi:LuxR family transcriptional regulator of csgAB operon
MQLVNYSQRRKKFNEMLLSHPNKQKGLDPETDALIYVIGKNSLNSELLVIFFKEQFNSACYFSSEYKLPDQVDQCPDKIHLIFISCKGIDKKIIFRKDIFTESKQHPNVLIVLCNVNKRQKLEKSALKMGVRGILYSQQTIDLFPKATRSILNGELWYPRRFLEEQFLYSDKPITTLRDNTPRLTRREREILINLAAGYSNQQIAKTLNISQHTVKTHAYNMYKKINVSNRMEAALWYSKNH